jgi:hypothetical protein
MRAALAAGSRALEAWLAALDARAAVRVVAAGCSAAKCEQNHPAGHQVP